MSLRLVFALIASSWWLLVLLRLSLRILQLGIAFFFVLLCPHLWLRFLFATIFLTSLACPVGACDVRRLKMETVMVQVALPTTSANLE